MPAAGRGGQGNILKSKEQPAHRQSDLEEQAYAPETVQPDANLQRQDSYNNDSASKYVSTGRGGSGNQRLSFNSPPPGDFRDEVNANIEVTPPKPRFGTFQRAQSASGPPQDIFLPELGRSSTVVALTTDPKTANPAQGIHHGRGGAGNFRQQPLDSEAAVERYFEDRLRNQDRWSPQVARDVERGLPRPQEAHLAGNERDA